jgi:hypothetical protein
MMLYNSLLLLKWWTMPEETLKELDHLIGLAAIGVELSVRQQRKLDRLMDLYEEICC